MRRPAPIARTLLLAAAAGVLAGCMQMSYVVRLNEDGSGRVTEVILFGPKIVRLEKKLAAGRGRRVDELLTEERLKERAKLMGEGVTVASFQVEETKGGGRRLTAVYAFRDINDLTLCMFPLEKGWENSRLKFEYGVSRNGKRPWIHLRCTYEHCRKPGIYTPRWKPDTTRYKPASELEMQKVRRLLPVFKDMLRGFRLTVRLEVYEHKKWASWARGHPICKHANHISVTGGRETLIDVRASDLLTDEDVVMALVAWRQLGAELKIKRALDLYCEPPDYQWLPIQHAKGREYY